jgi:hypothetical protein
VSSPDSFSIMAADSLFAMRSMRSFDLPSIFSGSPAIRNVGGSANSWSEDSVARSAAIGRCSRVTLPCSDGATGRPQNAGANFPTTPPE